MKLDLHITFEPGVFDIQFNAHNAQINSVEHDHGLTNAQGEVVGLHMNVSVDAARFGTHKSLLTVRTDRYGFTFAPADLALSGSMRMPTYGVTIALRNARTAATRHLSKLDAVAQAPEASFEHAAAHTQDVACPTLLGLGLDNRQFLVDTDLQTVRSARSVRPADIAYRIPIGRGKAVRTDVHRRLDGDQLPILRGEKRDEDIRYDTLMFATVAGQTLQEDALPGTPFLVAEEGLGMPHTPAQVQQREQQRNAMNAQGQPNLMLCYRLTATNLSGAPAYAFFYQPRVTRQSGQSQDVVCQQGVLQVGADVYGTAYFEGQPWIETQIVVLLAPGETVQAEYRLLHEAMSLTSSDAILMQPFEARLDDARRYWQARLDTAATLQLPEARIQNMLRAGLLHLYLVTYGTRTGTLAPTIGVYSPIGSESSPIIQFYDSMGWHDTAQRSLQYFLDKQHDDGRFQNFGGYMLETGAVLYTLGEHYRYTRDDAWVSDIKDQVLRACDWIIRHRHQDAPPLSGGHGSGMIAGKVADPEDHFRQYMLNAYQYLGLARAAEMLRASDPTTSEKLGKEADAFRQDIRKALAESLVRSPLMPLGDGRWAPPGAPWVEASGPDAMSLQGQSSYTHEAVYARDSMLGPLYTVFAEVIEPHETLADFLVETHYEHMCFEGAAFSQPYYSRHPQVHLRRGEVKAFLRSFYGAMAALADRETYSFWEHLFGVSPHKTHEEGWFLMEARHMLYMESDFNIEDGGRLDLLPGIPRAYLRQGQSTRIERARSYYGELSLHVSSRVEDGVIECHIACPDGAARGLKTLTLRLPHPDTRHMRQIDANGVHGRDDPLHERITFEWPAANQVHVIARY
jgi:hypothetical protein